MEETDLETGRQESNEWCICRVPEIIRNVKPSSYTPRIVSIGPLHHGSTVTEEMENLKMKYQEDFSKRKKKVELEGLRSRIKNEERRIRNCYADKIDLDSDSFVSMVLFDATFIIELFLKLNDGNDDCANRKHDIYRDLVLFENQLPFFILENLYNHAFHDILPENNIRQDRNSSKRSSKSKQPFNFKALTLQYFKDFNKQDKTFGTDVKHFTDLFRYFLLPKVSNQSRYGRKHYKYPLTICFPQLQHKQVQASDESEKICPHLPCATELKKSGVKFKKSGKKCLLDIEFTDGTLKMPCLEVYNHKTELIFRNVMAFEQCHYSTRTRTQPTICDYVRLMDFLIKNESDVGLLVRKGIVSNLVGSYQETANIVSKLSVGITECGRHYNNLIMELNEHHQKHHHWWFTSLIREYFGTPWRGASTIAAVVLLVLTFIQTICSLIQLNS